MSKRPYERPTMVKHIVGMMNEMGMPSGLNRCTDIDGISVDGLLKEFGSPLVVFSETVMRRKLSELKRAFELRYPKGQIAWSYKTNYLKAVCSVMHQEGSWAEVVSEHEYEMARRLGVSGNRIVYNGPYKPEQSLMTAVKEGAIINIDSLVEVHFLEKLAASIGKQIEIGMRINMDTGMYPAWDRFGSNLESGQAYEVAKRIISGGKLKLVSIHAHIGTFILEPKFYLNEVMGMCAFASRLKDEFGVVLKYFDIGGGFASRNRLKSTYLPTTYMAPSFDAYAENICKIVLEAFPHDNLPTLILETGRALVDEAGSLITTVVATKRLPSGIRAIILDAGVNLMVTSFWYDMEMMPVQDRGAFLEDHVIYGPLCMQIDVVRDYIKLPPLDKGDALVVRPFGAYNTSQWMQFIRMRPPVILIGEDGSVDIIREAEDVAYLQEKEILPERLTLHEEN
ncbi:MAG: diaminopimelate decarboxylase [Deltaproteobacteria bacterium]|nr:diaminopimelate decarboxylase [Deltaproteobacteria bacterium]